MSAPDDELVGRYRQASELEDARPGAHVRDAVRAHALMQASSAAGKASLSVAPGLNQAAANQSRWKLSALATVALVGLTGLLVLQFERGTPEERDTAFGQRQAEASRPAAAPALAPPAARARSMEQAAEKRTATLPTRTIAQDGESDLSSSAAKSTIQKPDARDMEHRPELAKAAPAQSPSTATREVESTKSVGDSSLLTDVPASPPGRVGRSIAAAPSAPPDPYPSSAPHAEMPERSLVQKDAVSSDPQGPAQTSAPPAPNLPNRKTIGALSAKSEPSAPASPNLWQAARAGNSAEVERLIGQGAPVNGADELGKTALMLSATNGKTATVLKLLALGANPSLTDREGRTAAQQARRLGHTQLADLIDAAR